MTNVNQMAANDCSPDSAIYEHHGIMAWIFIYKFQDNSVRITSNTHILRTLILLILCKKMQLHCSIAVNTCHYSLHVTSDYELIATSHTDTHTS